MLRIPSLKLKGTPFWNWREILKASTAFNFKSGALWIAFRFQGRAFGRPFSSKVVHVDVFQSTSRGASGFPFNSKGDLPFDFKRVFLKTISTGRPAGFPARFKEGVLWIFCHMDNLWECERNSRWTTPLRWNGNLRDSVWRKSEGHPLCNWKEIQRHLCWNSMDTLRAPFEI